MSLTRRPYDMDYVAKHEPSRSPGWVDVKTIIIITCSTSVVSSAVKKGRQSCSDSVYKYIIMFAEVSQGVHVLLLTVYIRVGKQINHSFIHSFIHSFVSLYSLASKLALRIRLKITLVTVHMQIRRYLYDYKGKTS